jgi:hypothetical protein
MGRVLKLIVAHLSSLVRIVRRVVFLQDVLSHVILFLALLTFVSPFSTKGNYWWNWLKMARLCRFIGLCAGALTPTFRRSAAFIFMATECPIGRFRRSTWTLSHRLEDEGSTFLGNVGAKIGSYTASNPRKHPFHLRDFRLPPRFRLDLRSSGLLRSPKW